MLLLRPVPALGWRRSPSPWGCRGAPMRRGRWLPPPRPPSPTSARGAAAAARVRLREAPGDVHREPRADRRARPLLRAGQPVRLLHDAERGRHVVAKRHAAVNGADGRRRSRSRSGSSAGTRRSSRRAPTLRPASSTTCVAAIREVADADPAVPRCRLPRPLAGIDLRLREQSGVLKYEFHVQPGRLAVRHQAGLRRRRRPRLNDDGELQISTALGVLQDSAPVSYQDIDGVRTCRCRAATCSAPVPTRASRSPSAATSAITNW